MFKKTLIIFCIILLIASISEAGTKIETKTSPNYLVVLVHGVNTPGFVFKGHGENGSDVTDVPDNMKGFGDLLGYLRRDLGLDGYVYYYTFSQRDGRIEPLARELGDRSYHNLANQGSIMNHKGLANQPDISPSDKAYPYLGYPATIKEGNCWLEQAREDFREWFRKSGPGKPQDRYPTEAEVPKKYILICHSMGGLVGRAYMTSNYYRDDVASIITIDSQHLGSNGALALKRVADFYDSGEDQRQYQQLIGITFFLLMMGQDVPAGFTGISAIAMPTVRYLADEYLIKSNLGYYPDQPGVQDMTYGDSYIKSLNSKPFVNSSSPVKVRMISGRGVPTPSGDLPANQYLLGLEAIQTVFSSSYLNDIPMAGKLMAIYMSVALGAIMNQDGDIYGTQKSQIGEGLTNLSAANISYKNLTYKFGDDEVDPIKDLFLGMFVSMTIAETANLFGGPLVAAPIKMGIILSYAYPILDIFSDRYANYLCAHGLMLQKVYTEKLIDQALDDISIFGGAANTLEAKSGLTASSVNNVTAGYSAPYQAFALLSNLDNNGNPVDTYHTVTIEAFTEGGSNKSQLFPIEVNGQKKWVSAITVKEPPTLIKGVINTFLPKKLRKFEYSENFAAWKPVGGVDEWGNFQLNGLKLAEGQNVIAFNSESWTGIKNNQHLKIILNSIPMQPSKFAPVPGLYISDSKPTISVEFNKSEYTGSYESEKIDITEMAVDGEPVAPQIESKMSSYHPWAKASYKVPDDKTLSEGEHSVVVKAQSNVGASQGVWSFYVDRSPPAISIEAIAPYSPRAPATIRYLASDEVSPNLLSVRCDLYDSNNNFITNIATADALSKGDNYFTWKPADNAVPADGEYKVRIKALDLAGNACVAERTMTIDSTPPVVASVNVTPNPMTSNAGEMSLTSRVSEKATVIIKLINTTTNKTTAYLTQGVPTRDPGLVTAAYSWKYNDMFSQGPEDGIYNVEVSARDEAGNESAPRTLEAVRIDRTPPLIYGQICNPYVLSNIGANAYQTTLSYNLTDAASAKIKIYSSNTGQVVETIASAPSAGNAGNNVAWDGSDPALPKGAYKFQIIAEDDVGNIGTAYASCVKDGIAPVISFPSEDNTEVSGTISIRGTAIDPDWTNDKPFKDYQVYYKKTGEDWKADFVEVPLVNRDPKDPKNISIRPLQNNATLAYLYTNSLENGEYTIRVVVDEEGHDSIYIPHREAR